MSAALQFDPVKFKATTRAQWETAADAWHRWGTFLGQWLGPATELMLDMAKVSRDCRVLDVAAGAGEQSFAAACRVGPNGHVLITDIAPSLLKLAAADAERAGIRNVATRELDGESLDELPAGSFDVVMSRVGLIYFPDQQRALAGMKHVLTRGGRVAAIVYSTADRNPFFSIPVGIIRRRAALPPPLPGQPGPFSLGGEGALAAAFGQAGFRDIDVRKVDAPVRLASAAECTRFEQESFGALHQMMASLSETDRMQTWQEIESALRQFETADGFTGPCEMLVGVASRS